MLGDIQNTTISDATSWFKDNLFLLATVSPAVCGPVMLKLQQQNRGTDKNIPSFVPAACCFDNTFSIIVVTMVSAITFTDESKFSTLVKQMGEMILSTILGISMGCVLWYFPLPSQKSSNSIRTLLIIFLSTGIIIGMTAVNHGFPGVVACLVLCFVAPLRWRTDNPKKLAPVANFFAKTWFYVASPLLFSLVGTFLDFTKISVQAVYVGLILVVVGTLARLASGFAIVACSPLNLGEQFIVVWSLVPKATVQAALGPNLFVLAEERCRFKDEASFVVISCIIAVLITAPIGSFVLDFSAPILIRKKITNQIVPNEMDHEKKIVGSMRSENNKFGRVRTVSLQIGIGDDR
ncbi:hypothetical protein V3C99_005346 [Haemonchus contortus]